MTDETNTEKAVVTETSVVEDYKAKNKILLEEFLARPKNLTNEI